MPKRRKSIVARRFLRFAVLGAAIGSLAAVSAYAMRPMSDAPPAVDPPRPPVSNAAGKADRLPLASGSMPHRPASRFDAGPVYALAAVHALPDFDAVFSTLLRPAPAEDEGGAARTTEPAVATPGPDPVPLPPERPKLPPPPQPAALLDDAQIAALKGRLRLTPEQVEHWPAVEAALREVVRVHLSGARLALVSSGRASIDVNSPEVQRLIWAAMPLLRQLREDQKREVRQLVRVIGLGSVAAHI